MLGQEVCKLLETRGFEYIGTDLELDFTSTQEVEQFCDSKNPEWIINFAAYTAVDKAESEIEKAALLNTTGPYNLAVCASKIGARLIHVSTDYVFGNHVLRRPLQEDDEVNPESVYGSTKLEGEEAIRNNLNEHFIIRISWLYGMFGKNFVYTMLSLMSQKPEIKVVDDQWGSPTWSYDVADVFVRLIDADSASYGPYHYSGDGSISWYDFSIQIQKTAREFGMVENNCQVKPCSTEEFPTAAKRPSWSVFSKEKIKKKLDISVPDWKDSLRRYLVQAKEVQ
jgi:dTDP-4-dehydrorhamnose reductase